MCVVNLRTLPARVAVTRIDRRSKWGNPFKIGPDGTRTEVLQKYREWLWSRIKSGDVSLSALADLDGKTLGCWCAPEPCHGHILERAARWANHRLASAHKITEIHHI